MTDPSLLPAKNHVSVSGFRGSANAELLDGGDKEKLPTLSLGTPVVSVDVEVPRRFEQVETLAEALSQPRDGATRERAPAGIVFAVSTRANHKPECAGNVQIIDIHPPPSHGADGDAALQKFVKACEFNLRDRSVINVLIGEDANHQEFVYHPRWFTINGKAGYLHPETERDVFVAYCKLSDEQRKQIVFREPATLLRLTFRIKTPDASNVADVQKRVVRVLQRFLSDKFPSVVCFVLTGDEDAFFAVHFPNVPMKCNEIVAAVLSMLKTHSDLSGTIEWLVSEDTFPVFGSKVTSPERMWTKAVAFDASGNENPEAFSVCKPSKHCSLNLVNCKGKHTPESFDKDLRYLPFAVSTGCGYGKNDKRDGMAVMPWKPTADLAQNTSLPTKETLANWMVLNTSTQTIELKITALKFMLDSVGKSDAAYLSRSRIAAYLAHCSCSKEESCALYTRCFSADSEDEFWEYSTIKGYTARSLISLFRESSRDLFERWSVNLAMLHLVHLPMDVDSGAKAFFLAYCDRFVFHDNIWYEYKEHRWVASGWDGLCDVLSGFEALVRSKGDRQNRWYPANPFDRTKKMKTTLQSYFQRKDFQLERSFSKNVVSFRNCLLRAQEEVVAIERVGVSEDFILISTDYDFDDSRELRRFVQPWLTSLFSDERAMNSVLQLFCMSLFAQEDVASHVLCLLGGGIHTQSFVSFLANCLGPYAKDLPKFDGRSNEKTILSQLRGARVVFVSAERAKTLHDLVKDCKELSCMFVLICDSVPPLFKDHEGVWRRRLHVFRVTDKAVNPPGEWSNLEKSMLANRIGENCLAEPHWCTFLQLLRQRYSASIRIEERESQETLDYFRPRKFVRSFVQHQLETSDGSIDRIPLCTEFKKGRCTSQWTDDEIVLQFQTEFPDHFVEEHLSGYAFQQRHAAPARDVPAHAEVDFREQNPRGVVKESQNMFHRFLVSYVKDETEDFMETPFSAIRTAYALWLEDNEDRRLANAASLAQVLKHCRFVQSLAVRANRQSWKRLDVREIRNLE
eukprot:ANDGO_01349.mRNA.1 hypothetical protein